MTRHMLETDPTQAFGIRLLLDFVDDRFVSSVQLRDGKSLITVLESIEGDSRTLWPWSPPIQQLHQQASGKTEFVAGVGMAGKGHWSYSITAEHGQPYLDFDCACRVKETPEWLGSSYKTLHVDTLKPILPDGGLLVGDLAFAVVSPQGDERSEIEVGVDRIAMRPNLNQGELPRTVRWKYRLQVTRPDGSKSFPSG